MDTDTMRNPEFYKWEQLVLKAQNPFDYMMKIFPDGIELSNRRVRLDPGIPLLDEMLRPLLREPGVQELARMCGGYDRLVQLWCYKTPTQKPLLDEARAYREAHAHPMAAPTVTVLTHPAYPEASEPPLMKDPFFAAKYSRYCEKLDRLFKWRQQHPLSINLVVTDTAEGFAASTSCWLRDGKVNDAVFTIYDFGYPLPDEMHRIAGFSKLFFGGIKGDCCVGTAVDAYRSVYPGASLFPVRDLIVSQGAESITLSQFGERHQIPAQNILALDNLMIN